ncbi:MAG: zinc-finger domain-containing protein [Rhodocyclales bacterium]|nr:zinc-finger domain-containing protein [Rhodocyclales bacterium]
MSAPNPLETVRKERELTVRAEDLPLHCPLPGEPVNLLHPRVFLDPTAEGEAVCPYCSRRFRFEGPLPKSHH